MYHSFALNRIKCQKLVTGQYFGKGMEHLKVGDIVEFTCEIHSLYSGICDFYNPTGKNDIEVAKKMHQYAIEAEHQDDPYDYPGKFTRDCFVY